jgi:hypothetical protein
VQSTGRFHDCIGHAILGIAQDILNDARTLCPSEIMFYFDPNLCQLPVGSFLGFCEFSPGWLFFAWQVFFTAGS